MVLDSLNATNPSSLNVPCRFKCIQGANYNQNDKIRKNTLEYMAKYSFNLIAILIPLIKMTLKTLKDFEGTIPEGFDLVHSVALRSEAIKWVKEAKENNLSTDWLTFFNITEEDLK